MLSFYQYSICENFPADIRIDTIISIYGYKPIYVLGWIREEYLLKLLFKEEDST
jgi:hypothetical protein